jgi:hypothetical protein
MKANVRKHKNLSKNIAVVLKINTIYVPINWSPENSVFYKAW